jgi:hypothetical protein
VDGVGVATLAAAAADGVRSETRRDGGALAALNDVASRPIRARAARREQMPCSNTAAVSVNGQREGPRAAGARRRVSCLWLGASGALELALAAGRQPQHGSTPHSMVGCDCDDAALSRPDSLWLCLAVTMHVVFRSRCTQSGSCMSTNAGHRNSSYRLHHRAHHAPSRALARVKA